MTEHMTAGGTLEETVLFGSVSQRVRASWQVVPEVQPLLGSVEEVGVAFTVRETARVLRISGAAAFRSHSSGVP